MSMSENTTMRARKITHSDYWKCTQVPRNIMAVNKTLSLWSNIGVIVTEYIGGSSELTVMCDGGFRTKKYGSLRDLLLFEEEAFDFYYIEIKTDSHD